MANFIKLSEELHNRVLVFRSIQTIVQRDEFKRFYDSLDPLQQDAMRIDILAGNIITIRKCLDKWIKDNKVYEEYSYTELRDLGVRLRIPNYSRMQKGALIEEIRKHEQKQG